MLRVFWKPSPQKQLKETWEIALSGVLAFFLVFRPFFQVLGLTAFSAWRMG